MRTFFLVPRVSLHCCRLQAVYSPITVKDFVAMYSHLSNNPRGWNKRGGGAKVAKSIIVEVGINVESGIF